MRYFCLSIPHFSAWAHAQGTPNLASAAFAVCENGQVVAPCPRAFAVGIFPGLSTAKAVSKFDGLELVQRNQSLEALAWSEVQQALYGLTPCIEPLRPGFLFCDAHPQSLKKLLMFWSQGGFRVTGGVAGDRATAHLAAIHAQSGTIRDVTNDWAFAGSIPIRHLISEINVTTIDDLEFFGWTTLSHLRPLSRRQLEEQLDSRHKSDGLTLFRFAQGAICPDNLRPIPQWTVPEQITAALSFELPATQPCEWETGLSDVIAQVCSQLGSRSAQVVEITVQTPVSKFSARRLLREPVSDPKSLWSPVQSALSEALQLLAPLPTVVQGFEVRLSQFTTPNLQTELWEDPAATRRQKMKGVLERLDSRLPGKMVVFGAHQTHSPFEEDRWNLRTALEQLGGSGRGGGRHATARA